MNGVRGGRRSTRRFCGLQGLNQVPEWLKGTFDHRQMPHSLK